MSEEKFNSDLNRTGELSNHVKFFEYKDAFELSSGEKLNEIKLAYETYGELNNEKSNAILVCHAISGDSHVARHDKQDLPGWWDTMVGPGKSIDTDKYFVICSNVIGGCSGSTGPNSINPKTGKEFGSSFPVVTIEDMVRAQKLLIDYFGIEKLLCVTGGSMGGFQSMQWSIQFPEKVESIIPIATSPRLTNQALAFDIVGRNAIKTDLNFKKGDYYQSNQKPEDGLAIARMLAHITYVSNDSLKRKFDNSRYAPKDISTEFENRFSVGSYLAYQGSKFVNRFDANSYITLSTAVDYFDIGQNVTEISKTLEKSKCKWLIISFSSDWLYPPFQSEEIVNALVNLDKPVSYSCIKSNAGHDAFLLERGYGKLSSSFLENISGISTSKKSQNISRSTTNIFFDERIDLKFITDLINDNERVLDLGCEDGTLLEELKKKYCKKLVGVEIDNKKVVEVVSKGIEVINLDINTGLKRFNDNQFDVVILSQTLQSIKNVDETIEEILRISNRAIISFPNFAYKPLREMLFKQGKAPKAEGLYGYNWYNTPNRRFPTLLDFQEFCNDKAIKIIEDYFLNTAEKKLVSEDPNLNCDTAIFVLSKN